MAWSQNLFSSEDYIAVTPADNDFVDAAGRVKYTRQVLVGGAGTIVCTKMDGTVQTLTAAAGMTFNIRTRRIAAASTGTNITALF